MFYKKDLPTKSQSSVKLSISNFSKGINTDKDQSVLDMNQSPLSYNFLYINGALKQGYGIGNVSLVDKTGTSYVVDSLYSDHEKFLKLWIYRSNPAYEGEATYANIFIMDDTYHIYRIIFDYTFIPLLPYTATDGLFTQVPLSAVSYRYNSKDYLVMSSLADGVYLVDPAATNIKVNNAPKITSMCVHYERIFATVQDNQNALWFCKEFDPTKWEIDGTGAGFIEMVDERGYLTKVISFLDYVYIFREYGIARLVGYADETEFVVSQIFSSSSKIYENTVCICGDVVLMLTGNGLYAFDGLNTKKINLGIDEMFEGQKNEDAVCCFYKGKYFLACKLNYPDEYMAEEGEYVNNSLLVYDTETGELSITRGIDIRDMAAIQETRNNKVVMIFRGDNELLLGELNDSGKFFNVNLKKFWSSPKTDLGYGNKLKLIKEVYLESDYPCELEVKCDNKIKKYSIKQGSNRIRINKRAKQLSLNIISTTGEARITPPKVYLGVV